MSWHPASVGTRGERRRLASRYSLTTGWARPRDCNDPITDGYGQPLTWWAYAVLTVLVPWFVLSALAFEMMAVRLDR